RDNLLHGGNRRTDERPVPYVVYTHPERGRVGMTEREAKEQGIAYKLARIEMKDAARAIETREKRGFWKELVDAESDKILGAAIFSMWGGEIMTMIELAMQGGLTASTLNDTNFFPSTLARSGSVMFSYAAAGS